MGAATAWDIFIIFVLLFVIFGRKLMPGMWRGLCKAISSVRRPAAKADDGEATSLAEKAETSAAVAPDSAEAARAEAPEKADDHSSADEKN